MTTIQPRHPVLGIVRLLALGWTLLSLLGLVGGALALVYAGGWGCIGHHLGWFGCTFGIAMIPFASLFSLVVAVVVLFFAHVFYVAGARAERAQLRKPSLRGLVGDVVADILD
ncbi:MAG TPA: hypothetical protein VEY50_12580 [Lysobacter sp.]|nr:hypothetical protein [Lysobacter sp.]